MKTGQSDFSSSVQVHSGRAGTWCKDQDMIRTIHTACRLINTNGLNYRTICWTKLCTVVKQVLAQLKYPCLSEIWKIKIHHRVGHWSKNFRTAFETRRTHQKGHKRKSVNIFGFFSSQVESGSTISLRMLNWLGKKWSGSINSIWRAWFKTELHYGRLWVVAVDSTCGTVRVIGWDSTDGLISTIQCEIMISMDGMIRWTITGSKTGMIRHENLSLVELVDKNATLGRIHDPSRSMLDLGHNRVIGWMT